MSRTSCEYTASCAGSKSEFGTVDARETWRFAVTFFPDWNATVKTEEWLNAYELIARIEATSAPTKKRLPWLKFATFGDVTTDKGCLRNDANVRLLSGILVDYDGEVVSLDDAADKIYDAGLDAIIYSSPSCTPTRPRYRVACPSTRQQGSSRVFPRTCRRVFTR